MATVNVFPLAVYAAGTYQIPSTAIPDSVTKFKCAVARCTSASPKVWPNASDSITFDLQYSLDNGTTWLQWFSGTSTGGIVVTAKTGREVQEMLVEQAFPAGINRRVRGSITLSASIRTRVELTVL